MNVFWKQMKASSLGTILLVSLLLLSIVISSFGFSTYMYTSQQVKVIDEDYITIAVPLGTNFEETSKEGTYLIDDDNYIFNNGKIYISPRSAEETAKESKYYVSSDNRVLLSAHIPGSINLSSGTLDPMDYNAALDQYVYSLSVLAVRCVSVQEVETWRTFNQKSYEAYFEILDAVCWVDAYNHTIGDDLLVLPSRIYTADGEIPFEEGKTYLLRGGYRDYEVRADFDIVTDDAGNKDVVITGRIRDAGLTPRNISIDPFHPMISHAGTTIGLLPGWDNWTIEQKQDPESGMFYWCTPEENCWPYFAEYCGDWQDYLKTAKGSVWIDEIIPYYERNHSSVPVILTDNVKSMYTFNTGFGSILEGAFFSNEDYASGKPVCIVSAAYAQVNGLSVGDTIHMDFYNTGYTQTTYPVLQGTGRSGITIQRYELRDETRINYEDDYTIVGIYSAPEWEAGSHSFHADTIFVPKSSVPYAENYFGDSVPLLNTVIIKNGSVEAFEAHMAANDKAGVYAYYDQGYAEAKNTVNILNRNAQRIMIVGISLFILSSLLFLLLYIRKIAPAIRTMRLLGVSVKKTWMECFTSLIGQVAIAVLIGNTLAVVLYDRITQMLLSASLELSYGSVALCGAVQFLVLFVAGMIWTRSVANRNLMQKR